MNIKTIAIAAAVFVGYKFLSQKKDELTELKESVIASIADVSMDWSNPIAPKLFVQVDITNPSQGAATLTDIFATIKHADTGTTIGTINQHMTIPIEPMQTSGINVPVTINGLNIIMEIIAGAFEPNIKIEGYAKANGIKIDFTKEVGLPF